MKNPTPVSFLIVLLVVNGCQSDRPQLESVRSDWIEDGTTTMPQIGARMGMPRFVQRMDGVAAVNYYGFHEERTTQGQMLGEVSETPRIIHFNSLSVLAEKDKVVTAHWEHHSSQGVKAAQLEGGPRLHFGPVLDSAATGRIKRGESTEKELVSWFGEPSLAFMAPDKTLTLVWIEGKLASSISRRWGYHALSVALDDHGVAVRHSTMETEKIYEAMGGLLSR